MKSDVLKGSRIFCDLEDGQIEKLTGLCQEESYAQGEDIFGEGQEADKLFVLEGGLVTLKVQAKREIDLAATIVDRTGEVFGTAALLKPHRHRVTAHCSKLTRVLTLRSDKFFNMVAEDHSVGFKVMKGLAEMYASRLNSTRSLITNLFKIFRVQTAKSALIQTYQESE